MRRPCGRRVIGDRDMHDASPFVRENHQHEQHAIRDGRDHEEVGGHHLPDVVREERLPRLRRWPSATPHVFRDGGLIHGYPELLQLAVDAGRTPERVRVRHRADQHADIGRPVPCRLFEVQKRRNPRRCHATTVSGCTRTSARRHSVRMRENHTQSNRSAALRRRRGRRERSSTWSWCVRARISACTVARERSSERSDRSADTTMGITDRRLFDRNENLNKSARTHFLVRTGGEQGLHATA